MIEHIISSEGKEEFLFVNMCVPRAHILNFEVRFKLY